MPTPPRFSVVIPAYNEAAIISELFDSVDAARSRYRGGADAIEVIVGNNDSTDATAAIAVARGCQVAQITKRNIGAARNGGAAIARGEILCFIDADSTIHINTFNAIDDAMSSGKLIVGATGVRPERWSVGIFFTWLLVTPLTWLAALDAGVIFCFRRDFESIGGYDESMDYAEDIQLLRMLKQHGRASKRPKRKFGRARNAQATTSMRKYDKHGDWHYFTLMPRIGFWLLTNKQRMKKEADAYWYQDR